jgi:hypothetical protein
VKISTFLGDMEIASKLEDYQVVSCSHINRMTPSEKRGKPTISGAPLAPCSSLLRKKWKHATKQRL